MDETALKEAFESELKLFTQLSNEVLNRVLVFPCINSYARLKLHELTKETFKGDLASFSVGQEPDRRPVICKQQLLANWTLKSVCITPKVTPNAGRRPPQALYVPRALRNQKPVEPATVDDAEPTKDIEPLPELKTWQDEIEAMTGPVQLVQPLTDFLALESGCVSATDQAFKRVIEMGDFPKELKTTDLENVLHSNVKIKNYYDLKWVDDTHALVIFTDELTAAQALAILDPQIKFRPFYLACDASKSRAKSISIEPSVKKTRPDTSTVMARRLLSRALNNPNIKANKAEENALKEAAKNKEQQKS